MADKILLSIGVDEGEIGKAVKAIQDARTKIDALKSSQKELEKQGQKNSETYILQEQEIKKLNGVVSENSKIFQAASSAVKANEDSLKALKKETSELIKQRDTFSIKTDEGRKKIAELNAQIDENNLTIRENSSALEKQRINIGNYASALDNVVPGLGGFATNLGTASEASGGFTKGLLSMARAALAFIATPLGLILAGIALALKTVMTFLTGTTEGVDFMEKAMAAASAVIGVLTDRVISFARAAYDFLTLDFKGFAENSQKAFAGLADELEREVGLAWELTEALQELEDREVNFEIAASKNENTIKRLLLQAKNRTLAEKERIDLIDQAMKVEGQQTEELIRNKEKALEIANKQAVQNNEVREALIATGGAYKQANESEAEFAQRIIDTGKAIDALRDPIKEALIARNNAEGASLAFQEKIQNQRDALAEKAEAERQKRADKEKADREKREEEIRKAAETEEKAAFALAVFRREQDILQTKSTEDRINKEIDLETFKRTFLLSNEELTASERQLIIEQSEAAITEIQNNAIKARKEAFDADNAARAQQRDVDLENAIGDAEEYLQREINKEQQRLLDGQISRQEYDDMMYEAELAALIAEQELRKKFGEEDIALDNQILAFKIANMEKEKQIKEAVERAKFDVAQSVFGQTAALFNKNTIAFKLAASAEAAINTYKAATAAYATGSALPPPAGLVAGPILAALAIATGLANVAKINNVKLTKLEQGDRISKIQGRSHQQGGEILSIGGNPVAEVEGGEDVVVLKRGAREKLSLLSQANRMAGGKDFYTNRKPMYNNADGGFVARTVDSAARSEFDINKMANVFSRAVEGIPAPIVKVTDIERVQTKTAKVSAMSELS
jgi:predicted phage tail protein